MAITTTIANSAPYLFSVGTATKSNNNTLPNIPTVQTNDVCLCERGCEYTENVFAEISGEWYKNDKNDFLLQKQIAADTIVFKLYKNDVELVTITNDTYGDFYDFGDLGNSLYTGFVVHWENVYTSYGAGYYKIKADKVILGASSTFTSQNFRLLPYSDNLADGTFRLESYQTGNIISSEFDYTDLLSGGWYSSFRIDGRLYAPSLKIEIDRNLDINYEQEQMKEKISNEWMLEVRQISSQISNRILYDNSLANKYLLTDYNKFNHEVYRRKELYVTDIEKTTEPDQNRNRSYKLKLSDKIDNNIKRNF